MAAQKVICSPLSAETTWPTCFVPLAAITLGASNTVLILLLSRFNILEGETLTLVNKASKLSKYVPTLCLLTLVFLGKLVFTAWRSASSGCRFIK